MLCCASIQLVAADEGAGEPLRLERVGRELVVLSWDPEAIRRASRRLGRLTVSRVPLAAGLTVDLDLEPFRVTGPDTQFVVGRKNGPDRPLDFDPSSVAIFRGKIVDRPGSHVFLTLSERGSSGYVDLGAAGGRYRISSRDESGRTMEPHSISIFRAAGSPSLPPHVPLCSTEGAEARRATKPGANSGAGALGEPAPRRNTRHLELAVETDHEFFSLFGDVDLAATYLVQMYAEVSDTYLRDVDTWVELVFARVWDNPDDLFNVVDPTPIFDFQAYWAANMGAVQRDVAQLLSGRRDYPFGGQAFLGGFCNGNGYSVVGYALGFFPDPTFPSPYHYDISVTAHELGHNANAPHTHAAAQQIDTCNDPSTTAQRGTIMSYCGQTWSGGNANRDLYFHTAIRQIMDQFITSAACVVPDCNRNGVEDALDIQQLTSLDQDATGIPDECEDCNGNAVLDEQDILSGTSLDLNLNGIPDACDPDCDGDDVPDDHEIFLGTSTDAYGNGVPDQCEADCDGNGVSDYSQIQLNMTLDIDRNAVLDSCQDCGSGAANDLEALGQAHGIWVGSGRILDSLRSFYASTGVLTGVSTGQTVDEAQDLVVTVAGHVLVSSGSGNRVMEFDAAGVYLGDLVPGGSGFLLFPTGLYLMPSGTLLVASRDTHEVLKFDSVTGTPQGRFVLPGAGGLSGPFGMTFGPNGNFFISSGAGSVLEFDGQTGTFVGVFVDPLDNGGLDRPRGMTFKADGNLLVASFGTNEVLEFDGETGAPLGKWAQVGTATRLTQVSPWGIRVGPNGNVFVVRTGEDFGSAALKGQDHGALHLTNAQIYEFDVKSGNFLRTHVGGNDHGLLFPTGFAFVPGWDTDCNLNLLPDSCDVASGFSTDLDLNARPDECDVDCNGSGQLDRLDIVPFGTSLDCNFNQVPDECEPGLTCSSCADSSTCAADGLSCTVAACNPAWGLCQNDVVPGACLVDELCRSPGEPNPSNDCEACDPAAPRAWSADPPVEVETLLLDRGDPTLPSTLTWSVQGPTSLYDVAGGSLSVLRGEGGSGSASCLAEDLGLAAWDDVAPPSAGDGGYYLVRAQKSCGAGTYGSASGGGERVPLAGCGPAR